MKKCQTRVLTPYLDGELSEDSRSQVEEHLRSCATCGAVLDEVTSARERVRDMGRAIIPDTILMPALEVFRERGGIGQGRQPAMPEPAMVETATAELEVLEPAQDMVTAAEPSVPADTAWSATDMAATEPAAVDEGADDDAYAAAVGPTWVNIAEPEPEPEPEPEVEPVMLAEPEPEAQPVMIAEPEVGVEPEFNARPELSEAVSPEQQYAMEAAAGAIDFDDDPVAAGNALEDRPEPPPPQAEPPWLEAEAADTEDIEAHGRRVVEEDLAAQRIEAAGWQGLPDVQPYAAPPELSAPEASIEAETLGDIEPVAETPHLVVPAAVAPAQVDAALDDEWHEPEDDVAVAVAGLRRELGYEPEATMVAAAEAPQPIDAWAGEYRGALRTHTERRRPSGLEAMGTQVKIGLAAAAAIVVLMAAVFAVPRLFAHHAAPVAATTSSHPSAAAPSPAGGTAVAPSPVASAAPVVPALAGVVSGGGGGTGYSVLRIRTGNPAAGISRIVLDLQGSGAFPDVQLGQAADGSLYLQSAGTTVDPAIAAAFPGTGPVTSVSPTGAPAMSLKLAMSRPARYTLYYLTGPARLVIDLR